MQRIFLLHEYRSWFDFLNVRLHLILPDSLDYLRRMLPPFEGRLELIHESSTVEFEQMGCLSHRPVFGVERPCLGTCLLLENEQRTETLAKVKRISRSGIESILKKALKVQFSWLSEHPSDCIDSNFPACYDLSDPEIWGIAKR